jgi:hypothetical protein
MVQQDDWNPNDMLGVGRGIVYGLVFGSLLWAAVIGAIVLWLR